MHWFSGTVSQAIHTVRNESRFLLVFVKGSDESSEHMDQQFDANAAAVCDGVVCLRLEASSEAAMQFSAVYVLLSVPCVYIIAPSGKVVDVKLGSVDKDELRDWIARHTHKQPVATCSATTIENSTVAENENQEQASDNQSDQVPLDQRVSLAYERMEEKRRLRLEEEKQKARDAEIKRRELGKTMQDFRERQRARDVEEAIAERRKEEVESRLLRERLRQQIEEDRRAFQERSQGMTNQSPTNRAPETTSAEAVSMQRTIRASENDLVRLQFRMIGGGHIIGRFTPDSTLAADVRNWLQQTITSGAQNTDGAGECPNVDENTRQKLSRLISQGYHFRQLHPPKLFEQEDELNTMVALGLCPSAVLLIVPNVGVSTSAIEPASGSWGSTIYGLVSTGFGALYSYTSWFLGGVYSFGSGFLASVLPRQRVSPQSTSSPAPTLSNSSEFQGNRAIRRHGNLARLSHLPDDSDDEQARWNGNSTEQL